jgi:hypothetical protein
MVKIMQMTTKKEGIIMHITKRITHSQRSKL